MTALDSNVLIALWDSDPIISQSASLACQKIQQNDVIGVCGPVFAELLGQPGRTIIRIRHLLEAADIQIDGDFGEIDWLTAGQAYEGYVSRRRSSGGGLPRKMLTDFLIGAHASVRGHSLLTLDRSTYRAAFPNLVLKSF
jgi:predicted nucleic acid-binding protein